MFFIRRHQKQDEALRDMEIIFATAVFGWDAELVIWYTEEARLVEKVEKLTSLQEEHFKAIQALWKKITRRKLRFISHEISSRIGTQHEDDTKACFTSHFLCVKHPER